MAYDPYNDPNRIAQQMAQRAQDLARQSSKRFQESSSLAAKNARDNAQRMFDQNSKRARDNFIRQTQDTGAKRGFFRRGTPVLEDSAGYGVEPRRPSRLGRFIGFLALLALIFVVGSRLLGW